MLTARCWRCLSRAWTPHDRAAGKRKAYDTAAHVSNLRKIRVTPNIAQNTNGRRSAIDGRTTRHGGYGASQRIRKRIEEAFAWIKQSAAFRKTRHRGIEKVGWMFSLIVAAYNLIGLPSLLVQQT
jgi:hypothetical protein